MQEEEAAPEGAAGEPAGGEAPLQDVQADVARGDCEAQVGYDRSRVLPPGLNHHRQLTWCRQPGQSSWAGCLEEEAETVGGSWSVNSS